MCHHWLSVFSLTSNSLHLYFAGSRKIAEQITMADWGDFLNKNNGSVSNEDFDEEEGVTKERGYLSPNIIRVSKDSSASSAWHIQTSPGKITRASNNSVTLPSSAPVDIPDWSKIYGMNGKKVSLVAVGGDHYHNGCDGDGDDDDGDEDEDGTIPPHEWIARKLARSQISSFSVCEGIGRTLKGRDLSKVRNAVLTKTGFIE